MPDELRVFSKGSRGFGMRKPADAVSLWPTLLEGWMKAEGFLGG